MIKTPTTFVIGAGASNPYGFPIGSELTRQARLIDHRSDLYRFILNREIKTSALETVLTDLREHPENSIDAYLETRQDESETMRIGKTIIAAVMARYLIKSRNKQVVSIEDWMHYIFRKMREGARNYDELVNGNNVKFVTFNFDTLIETRFQAFTSATYRTSGNYPPVIHVHGKLPPAPDLGMEHDTGTIYPEWITWLDQAASGINVVLDDIDNDTLTAVEEAVRSAEVICFLGFAYATQNLNRLGIRNRLQPGGPSVYGSAFGLEAGEQENVRSKFRDQIRLGHNGDGCLLTLRRLPVFRD